MSNKKKKEINSFYVLTQLMFQLFKELVLWIKQMLTQVKLW
jgi:hypothetical protein